MHAEARLKAVVHGPDWSTLFVTGQSARQLKSAHGCAGIGRLNVVARVGYELIQSTTEVAISEAFGLSLLIAAIYRQLEHVAGGLLRSGSCPVS